MIGTRLGPYELRAELGRGGMATVYRAYQPAVDREVALKVIHAASLHDPAARDRFRREARLIARLEHPNILPIYDFDGHSAPPYLVMRYLDRGTLRDFLATRRLSFADAARLVGQIAAALDYAHQQGIVHRDIKPSNVLLDRYGNAFVSDFGIARTIAAQPEGQITSSGAIVGTPDYMAPEQVQGRLEVDGRADVYALGVMIFQLLTGRLPFQADQPMAMLLQHVSAPIPSPRTLIPALPPAADDLIRRVLAKDPDARFATAGEAAASFSALAQTLSGGLAQPLLRQAPLTVVLERRTDTSATPLAPKTPTPRLSEQQRLVTVLHTSIADYHELFEAQAGAERALAGVNMLGDHAITMLAEHGGVVLNIGQSNLQAFWGIGSTAGNDPERAVWAALELRSRFAEAMRQMNISDVDPLPLRIGIHAGPVLVSPGDGPVGLRASGATIGVAQRLAEQAEGTILISHEIYRAVRGVFVIEAGAPIRLRGRSEPLSTYLVRSVQSRAFRTLARDVEGIETPLVGREAELTRMQRAYQEMLEEGETQLVTILGEAGLGKSRLLDAFNHWRDLLPDSDVAWRLQARSSPELTTHPYGLLRELLLFRFAILDDDPLSEVRRKLEEGVTQMLGVPADEFAQLIGQLVGFDFRDAPHVRGLLSEPLQLITRARRLFGQFIMRLCAISPVLIQLEDLHLADRESLALLSDLLRDQPGLRLMLIATARPGLRERFPAWGAGIANHLNITLGPLDRSASRELARALLVRTPDPPKALRNLLVERSGGNPLFMEELLRVLLDDRVLVKEQETVWRVEERRLGNMRVPTTLAGLLQARLDTLLAPERLTLQRAAIIGRTFVDTALIALDATDDQHVTDLPEMLSELVARGFVERRPTVAGAQEYAFSESLLREMLYSTMLDRQRQAYHRALAGWLETGERANEYLPLIAEHYEKGQAPAEAAAVLTRAGDLALGRSAFAQAEEFYTQAISLSCQLTHQLAGADLPHSSGGTDRLHLKRAEARSRQSDYAAAIADLDAALAASNDLRTSVTALAMLGELLSQSGDFQGAREALEQALQVARDTNDPATLTRVLSALGSMNRRLGNLHEARGYLEESLALARTLDDKPGLLAVQNRLATTMFYLGNLDQAEHLFQEVCTNAMALGSRDLSMKAMNNLGIVAKERGDLNGAQYLFREALLVAREIGMQDSVALCLLNLAEVEIRRGQMSAVRELLNEGLTSATELGALPHVVQGVMAHGMLAAVQGNQGRALALWGLAQSHPACEDQHLRNMERFIAGLGIDEATVSAGLAQGAALDFDITVAELLGT